MTKESEYAIFEYEKSDEALMTELASYLDTHVEKLYDFFEVDIPKQKVPIRIIPTKLEYDEICIKQGNDKPENWWVGSYHTGRRTITHVSLNDYKNTAHAFEEKDYPKALERYKKSYVHEYTHFVNSLFREKHDCGKTEKYLSEGIACYLSGQKDGLDLKFNFALDDIIEGKVPYDAYYLLTKYLVENYDKKFVFELFESNRQAREFLKNELYNKVNALYNSKKIETKQ